VLYTTKLSGWFGLKCKRNFSDPRKENLLLDNDIKIMWSIIMYDADDKKLDFKLQVFTSSIPSADDNSHIPMLIENVIF